MSMNLSAQLPVIVGEVDPQTTVGYVYELVAPIPGSLTGELKRYIGSCTTHPTQRLKHHLRTMRCYHRTGRGFCTSFEVLREPAYALRTLRCLLNVSVQELRDAETEAQRELPCVNERFASRLYNASLPVPPPRRPSPRDNPVLREKNRQRYLRKCAALREQILAEGRNHSDPDECGDTDAESEAGAA